MAKEEEQKGEVMERTALLSEMTNDADWDNIIHYGELDSIDESRSDRSQIRIRENSGAAIIMSYEAVNWLTLFAHHPAKALNGIRENFTSSFDEVGFSLHELSEMVHHAEVGGSDVSFVERRAVERMAELIREIEKRDVADVKRYYVTPHSRLVRKNYEHFRLQYITNGNTSFYVADEKPTKVIPREDSANSAMDW